jgi:photosystem II stability/assembly factor-like uncharacterized protein
MKQKLWFTRFIGIGMFLTVLSLCVFAQVDVKWREIGPWGGDIRDIKMKIVDSTTKARSTPNWKFDSTVVASYGAGVFINDSAATGNWISRNKGLPNRKVLCLGIRKIGYGDTMYVGMDGYGIYRTYDAGESWEAASGSGVLSIVTRKVYAIAVHPNQSWKILAATDQGLWKTVNCGATWTQVGAPVPTNQLITDVQWHEYSTGKVYASSAGSIYYSDDEGATFTAYVVNTTTINCLALAFSPYDTLFCGMQDGKVYEITFPPPTYSYTKRVVRNDPNYPVYSITINPKVDTVNGYYKEIGAADTLYLGTKYGVFKGTKMLDNNYTWVQTNNGLGNTLINSIVYYPGRQYINNDLTGHHQQNPWVFAGTGFNGIYWMHNNLPGGGASFTASNDSLPVGGIKVVSVNPLSSNILYTGGGYGLGSGLGNGAIWKSANASVSPTADPAPVTWTRVFPPEDTATVGKIITSITNSYYNSNYVLAADSLKGIYKSTDGGTSWTQVYNGTGVSYVHVARYIATQPTADTEKVFASRRVNGTWQILKSTNGGNSFTALSTTFNFPITSLIADSASPQYLYVTTWGAGVYRSTDMGSTFTQITTTNGVYNPNVYSLAVDDTKDTLVIGTEYGLFTSNDRGLTWVDDNNYGTLDGIDKVTNVYRVRDTVWSTSSGKGIFYRASNATQWSKATIEIGTNTFSPVLNDTLLLKDLDFIWKWTSGPPLPIAGYAASEIYGGLRRLNDANNIPFMNGTTAGAADSVYVYLPDTCSAFRSLTNESRVDIPIRIVNASFVDSFRVTIKAPISYFTAIDTTITTSTLTSGRSFTRYVNATDGSQCRWVFNSTTPFSTNSDTVLFKVRYKVTNDLTLNDSLPHPATNNDSSLHIVRGLATLEGGSAVAPEDSTDFMWRTSTDSNATGWGKPGYTTDTIGIFWLRHLPYSTAATDSNGLPGYLPSELTSYIDGSFITLPGEAGNENGYSDYNLRTEHDWLYTQNTGKSMIVRIRPTAYPTYPYLTWSSLPEEPIRTGDAIGAFYYRNDSLVCAGWGIWRADIGCTFVVWGDDDRTPLKDGFVYNEQLNFKIYDSRYKKVWPVPNIYTSVATGTATFVPNQITEYDTKFQGKLLQEMRLRLTGPDNLTSQYTGGWHLVSSYIYPVDPGTAVNDIFRFISNFYLMKDQTPNLYWPGIGINQILYWDVTKAYWIYMSQGDYNTRFPVQTAATAIIFRGTKIDPTISLPLTVGWNLIPYLGNNTYLVGSALASITGKYELVLDDSGQIYWPAAGMDQIGSLVPGKGYQIYMKQIATLNYPSAILTMSMKSFSTGGRIPELSGGETSIPHFIAKRVSPISQIIGLKLDGMTLREGDEIGVFTKDGLCVGSVNYKKNGKNQLAVTIFGNDEMSSKDVKTGANDGDALMFKVFTKADNKENTAEIKDISWVVGKAEGIVFKANTIAKVNLSLLGKILPTEYALDQNYPNPFNPTTTIRYALPEDGMTRIKIYDLLGREVRDLVSEQQIAGYYTIEWDGKNNYGLSVSTGMYMYKIEANKFNKTLKMMLMK